MKKYVFLIIISSLVFGTAGSWIFTRYIIPKLNTIPFLVKYNLAPKAAPLVINTREEIRVNEGSDTVAAIQRVEPWTVGILSGSQLSGGGIILTSDGLIAATKSVLNIPQLQIKLFDGTVLKAAVKAVDPGSDLVLISAQAQNLRTAVFGSPQDIGLGQRLAVLSPSLGDFQDTALVSYLSSQVRSFRYDQVFSSEQQNQTFSIDRNPAAEGATVLSLDGNIQGFFSKGNIITADTIKSAMNSYFNNNQKITRNFMGINYQYLPKALAIVNNQTEGIILKRSGNLQAVLPGSPASLAGLAEGDIITAVSGIKIDSENSFEKLLGSYNPGQAIKLSVSRGGAQQNFNLTLGSK